MARSSWEVGMRASSARVRHVAIASMGPFCNTKAIPDVYINRLGFNVLIPIWFI